MSLVRPETSGATCSTSSNSVMKFLGCSLTTPVKQVRRNEEVFHNVPATTGGSGFRKTRSRSGGPSYRSTAPSLRDGNVPASPSASRTAAGLEKVDTDARHHTPLTPTKYSVGYRRSTDVEIPVASRKSPPSKPTIHSIALADTHVSTIYNVGRQTTMESHHHVSPGSIEPTRLSMTALSSGYSTTTAPIANTPISLSAPSPTSSASHRAAPCEPKLLRGGVQPAPRPSTPSSSSFTPAIVSTHPSNPTGSAEPVKRMRSRSNSSTSTSILSETLRAIHRGFGFSSGKPQSTRRFSISMQQQQQQSQVQPSMAPTQPLPAPEPSYPPFSTIPTSTTVAVATTSPILPCALLPPSSTSYLATVQQRSASQSVMTPRSSSGNSIPSGRVSASASLCLAPTSPRQHHTRASAASGSSVGANHPSIPRLRARTPVSRTHPSLNTSHDHPSQPLLATVETPITISRGHPDQSSSHTFGGPSYRSQSQNLPLQAFPPASSLPMATATAVAVVVNGPLYSPSVSAAGLSPTVASSVCSPVGVTATLENNGVSPTIHFSPPRANPPQGHHNRALEVRRASVDLVGDVSRGGGGGAVWRAVPSPTKSGHHLTSSIDSSLLVGSASPSAKDDQFQDGLDPGVHINRASASVTRSLLHPSLANTRGMPTEPEWFVKLRSSTPSGPNFATTTPSASTTNTPARTDVVMGNNNIAASAITTVQNIVSPNAGRDSPLRAPPQPQVVSSNKTEPEIASAVKAESKILATAPSTNPAAPAKKKKNLNDLFSKFDSILQSRGSAHLQVLDEEDENADTPYVPIAELKAKPPVCPEPPVKEINMTSVVPNASVNVGASSTESENGVSETGESPSGLLAAAGMDGPSALPLGLEGLAQPSLPEGCEFVIELVEDSVATETAPIQPVGAPSATVQPPQPPVKSVAPELSAAEKRQQQQAELQRLFAQFDQVLQRSPARPQTATN